MTERNAWAARNPVADRAAARRAHSVARTLAREYARRGASAVVLSGSWARGDARRHSDIDLWAIGPRTAAAMAFRQGFIVSVKETTVRREVREMADPKRLGQAVLAWREALPLVDPNGVAFRLQWRAIRFHWRSVGRAADRYVAMCLTEWTEEAVKLVRLMALESWESAAVQRNLLAEAMAGLIALRERLLYHENELWQVVGRRMGEPWHTAQRTALGSNRSSFPDSCEAALELYRLTARACEPCLAPRQRELVAHACAAVGHRL